MRKYPSGEISHAEMVLQEEEKQEEMREEEDWEEEAQIRKCLLPREDSG